MGRMPTSGGRPAGRDASLAGQRLRIGRRRFLWGAGLLSAGAALACRSGDERVLTTLERVLTIGDDAFLRYGPGEPYEVRTELAEAQVGREGRRRSLVVFHQITDAQALDEESPLRGEWVDSCPRPLSTVAFRPHEALSLHLTASLIRQVNRIRSSPVTESPVAFLVHTGNAADNAQYNELRWFLDLMDGKPITPDSGSRGYEGVEEESPDRRYPDLLEEAQEAFVAPRLRFPWYAVIGNRDVLAQGNFAPDAAAREIALGDQKIIRLSEASREEACDDPSALLAPGFSEAALTDPDTIVRRVAADAGRRLLSRQEWTAEHLATAESPGPVGHGFSQANVDAGTAYYSFELGPLVFIALDTVNPAGFAEGSLDAAQLRWLEEQLVARSSRYFDREGREVATGNADRLIVILSHHPTEAMNNPLPDPATGEGRARGPILEALLHRFPNVVLHVAGHSHRNRIVPRPDPSRQSQGYWEVATGSALDFPMQGRLLEIVDNADGTLSVFSTVYDLSAPPDPDDARDPSAGDGVNEERLASIARLLAVRDPQLDVEAGGLASSDRNVEMLLRAPFDLGPLQARRTRRELLRSLLPGR